MKHGYFLLVALLLSNTGLAKDFTVNQKNKEFSQEKVNIKQGDTVHFKNDDPFFHNIFSMSELKSFDLGSYPEGKSRAVQFKEKGIVMVECAIHPDMQLEVVVE